MPGAERRSSRIRSWSVPLRPVALTLLLPALLLAACTDIPTEPAFPSVERSVQAPVPLAPGTQVVWNVSSDTTQGPSSDPCPRKDGVYTCDDVRVNVDGKGEDSGDNSGDRGGKKKDGRDGGGGSTPNPGNDGGDGDRGEDGDLTPFEQGPIAFGLCILGSVGSAVSVYDVINLLSDLHSLYDEYDENARVLLSGPLPNSVILRLQARQRQLRGEEQSLRRQLAVSLGVSGFSLAAISGCAVGLILPF